MIWTGHIRIKAALSCSGMIAATLSCPAFAQDKDAVIANGLEEIVVTAQKREQSLQDVPVAVTAVTEETLQANRIFNVNDLGSIAPGLSVRSSPGGVSVPAFTIRGQNSFGIVAGSDKQVSIYIDGVYISSPRGSIFDLPDIQRLEVLRGPQGTLFGRNATAGAISITTRDPNGEPRVRAEGSVGNQGAYRLRFTAATPEFGPFSAYASFVRNYRRGDVRNAAAGQVWDRSRSASGYGVQASPKWLGTADSESYFAAVKFEPSGDFKTVYKYDRNDDRGTPDASGFLAYNPNYEPTPGFGLGRFLGTLYATNNIYPVTNGKRPSIVTNGWAVPRSQRVQGHSLTTTWKVSDNITVKNTLAYRKAAVFSPTPIDGTGGLTLTPEALREFAVQNINRSAGSGTFFNSLSPQAQAFALNQTLTGLAGAGIVLGARVVVTGTQSESVAKQWSDELQLNYSSDRLNVTLGALWFHSNDEAGGPKGMQNTVSLAFIPASGLLPLGREGRYFNKATSLAAYGQIEYKIVSELELVAGARITRDSKSSSFLWDINGVRQPDIVPPRYRKTKPNFLVGLNWTPADHTLVYGKYSTSFVSGGSVAGLDFAPETARSFELGVKTDLWDRKLRTNLALFHVIYDHFQLPSTTTNPGSVAANLIKLNQLYGPSIAANLISSLSTFVNDVGKVRAQGVELEVTAAPTRGVTIGGNLGYTDTKLLFVQPNVLAGYGGTFRLTQRPKWTANLYGVYETEPLFGDATLQFRADGLYQSATLWSNSPANIYPANAAYASTPGYWLVNGRAALRHVDVGGANLEIAGWVKNLTDRRDRASVLFTPLATAATFIQARSYGLDVAIEF